MINIYNSRAHLVPVFFVLMRKIRCGAWRIARWNVQRGKSCCCCRCRHRLLAASEQVPTGEICFPRQSGVDRRHLSLAFTSDVSTANTTLQANIDAETTARIAGDASTLTSAKGYTDAQVLSGAVARAAGDTFLFAGKPIHAWAGPGLGTQLIEGQTIQELHLHSTIRQLYIGTQHFQRRRRRRALAVYGQG